MGSWVEEITADKSGGTCISFIKLTIHLADRNIGKKILCMYYAGLKLIWALLWNIY